MKLLWTLVIKTAKQKILKACALIWMKTLELKPTVCSYLMHTEHPFVFPTQCLYICYIIEDGLLFKPFAFQGFSPSCAVFFSFSMLPLSCTEDFYMYFCKLWFLFLPFWIKKKKKFFRTAVLIIKAVLCSSDTLTYTTLTLNIFHLL